MEQISCCWHRQVLKFSLVHIGVLIPYNQFEIKLMW